MSFNSKQVKSFAVAPLTAFAAAGGTWSNYSGSIILLNTKIAGSITSTPGLVIAVV